MWIIEGQGDGASPAQNTVQFGSEWWRDKEKQQFDTKWAILFITLVLNSQSSTIKYNTLIQGIYDNRSVWSCTGKT